MEKNSKNSIANKRKIVINGTQTKKQIQRKSATSDKINKERIVLWF